MADSDERFVAALVQRYCEASCTPEERAYVEGNVELLVRVALVRRAEAALQRLVAEAARAPITGDDRPSPQDLVAYVDGTLDEVRRRFVEQCAQRDPEIEEEIRLLRQLGNNPLTSE